MPFRLNTNVIIAIPAAVALVGSALGCSSEGTSELGTKKERFIFGPDAAVGDERIEHGAMSAIQQEWARSVAFHVSDAALSCSGATCTLATEQMLTGPGGGRLCEGTKFAGQKHVPYSFSFNGCTAFLVAPDLLATAGHCYATTTTATCANSRYFFGFNAAADGSGVPTSFPSADVYSCSSILSIANLTPDHAIVRLDRPVTGRIPFVVRHGGKIADAQQLLIYGHPWFLPLKLTQNTWVHDNPTSSYFFFNGDTFQGNSGGPAVNLMTGIVEGILKAGPSGGDDLVASQDSQGPCQKYGSCPDTGCPGTTSTDKFASALRTTGVPVGLTGGLPVHPAITLTLL
jgi:hypothetical protein